MRIALVTQPWARVLPPSESIAIWNLEVGRRLAAAGHEVAIWGVETSPSAEPASAPPGVAVRLVANSADWRAQKLLAPVTSALPARRPWFASPLFHAQYAAKVAAGVRRWNADVVHLHNFTQWVPLMRLARPRATIALHMHCDWLSQLHRPAMRRRAARADLVLAPSEAVSARNREALPSLAGRCLTVPNGVDLERFALAPRERDGDLRLLAIGRISPEKGVHRLLEAFDAVVARCPRARLELVGSEAPTPQAMLSDIEDDPVLRALARFGEHGYLAASRAALSEAAARRLELAGAVPHEDVPARLARADVLVAASLSEAFGMPVAEAMAAGVPVVATAIGGMREIVTDGVDGLLVPRDDADAIAAAVLRLAGDPELRARFIAEGRRTAAERFSWDAVADRVLGLYRGSRDGILPHRD